MAAEAIAGRECVLNWKGYFQC
jgi:hypothetical protein